MLTNVSEKYCESRTRVDILATIMSFVPALFSIVDILQNSSKPTDRKWVLFSTIAPFMGILLVAAQKMLRKQRKLAEYQKLTRNTQPIYKTPVIILLAIAINIFCFGLVVGVILDSATFTLSFTFACSVALPILTRLMNHSVSKTIEAIENEIHSESISIISHKMDAVIDILQPPSTPTSAELEGIVATLNTNARTLENAARKISACIRQNNLLQERALLIQQQQANSGHGKTPGVNDMINQKAAFKFKHA